MSLQEDIFLGFFQKLSDDSEFPESKVAAIKALWESGEEINQESLLECPKHYISSIMNETNANMFHDDFEEDSNQYLKD